MFVQKIYLVLAIISLASCGLTPEQSQFARNLAAASCQLTLDGCSGSTAFQNSSGSAVTQNKRIQAGIGFYQYDYTKGFNKVCVYDRLGSVDTLVISSVGICPLTIE